MTKKSTKSKQNKRIFLVTPFENALAKRGTRFIDIAQKLHECGWDVHYYTTSFSHAYKKKFSTKGNYI